MPNNGVTCRTARSKGVLKNTVFKMLFVRKALARSRAVWIDFIFKFDSRFKTNISTKA